MTRHWLHNAEDVAAAIAACPPGLDGWDLADVIRDEGDPSVCLIYVDDDGAVASFVLTVTDVDLDERRVKPEPREHEGRQR